MRVSTHGVQPGAGPGQARGAILPRKSEHSAEMPRSVLKSRLCALWGPRGLGFQRAGPGPLPHELQVGGRKEDILLHNHWGRPNTASSQLCASRQADQ